METTKANPIAYLETVVRNELADQYAELIASQNPEADLNQVFGAATEAARHFFDTRLAVASGELPFVRIATEVNGFKVEISHGEEK